MVSNINKGSVISPSVGGSTQLILTSQRVWKRDIGPAWSFLNCLLQTQEIKLCGSFLQVGYFIYL